MAILTKKRYRIGADFSMRDRDGERLEHRFSSGDVLPDELAATLTKREIESLMGTGMLREIGAPAPPKVIPEPPRPWTPAEILRYTAWSNADVVDGRVTGGPRGYTITVLDKAARESDLKRVTGTDHETQIIVHEINGVPVATLSLARLAPLLAPR